MTNTPMEMLVFKGGPSSIRSPAAASTRSRSNARASMPSFWPAPPPWVPRYAKDTVYGPCCGTAIARWAFATRPPRA